MIGDPGETIECANCGHANPPWAQVCRNCGASLTRSIGRGVSRPQIPFPTDQASLVSMGAGILAIALAVALGVLFSAINPTEPTVGLSSSPTPTEAPSATPTAVPSSSGTAAPSPSATPKPPGTITFGTGLNRTTKQVTGKTTSFGPNGTFAHSVSMPTAFGVAILYEEVVRVTNTGEELVQKRTSSPVSVSPNAKIFGFAVSTNSLLQDWGGGGVFVMRIYRGSQKIAEGKFTLSSG